MPGKPSWIGTDRPRMRYGLLTSFVNGIVRGASRDVMLTDGNESAYYYRDQKSYETFARYVREILPEAYIDKDIQDKYAHIVKAGETCQSLRNRQ